MQKVFGKNILLLTILCLIGCFGKCQETYDIKLNSFPKGDFSYHTEVHSLKGEELFFSGFMDGTFSVNLNGTNYFYKVFDQCLNQRVSRIEKVKHYDTEVYDLEQIENSQKFYMVLQKNGDKNLHVLKLHAKKGILWKKKIKIDHKNFWLSEFSIHTNQDKDLFIVAEGRINNSANQQVLLVTLKMTKQGNLKNSFTYRPPKTLRFPWLNDLSEPLNLDNGRFVVGIEDLLVFFDSAGAIESVKEYTFNLNLHISNISSLVGPVGDKIYCHGWTSNNSNPFIMEVSSKTGNVGWFKQYKKGDMNNTLTLTPDKNLLWMGHLDNQLFQSPLTLNVVDTSGRPIWSKVYPKYNSQPNPGNKSISIAFTSKGYMVVPAFGESAYGIQPKPRLLKMTGKGKLGCGERSFSQKVDSFAVQTNSITDYQKLNKQLSTSASSITFNSSPSDTRIECSSRLYPRARLGSDTIVCYDTTLTLSPGPDTSAFRYRWNTGAKTPRISVDTNGLYHVTVSYKGCIAKDSIQVTFLSKNPAKLRSDTLICPGDSIQLSLAPNGDQFLWQPPKVDTLANSDTLSRLDNWVSNEGIYRLYLDTVAQCPLDTLQLQHYEPPEVQFNSPRNICPYDSVDLKADTLKGTFHWQIPDTGQNIIKAPNIKVSDTGRYQLMDSTYGCHVGHVAISHYPLPEANAGPDTTLCFNQEYTMQGEGGIRYQWLPAHYLSSDTIPKPTARLPKKQVYALIVRNSEGCSDTSRVVLDVHPPLQVQLKGSDTAICEGRPLTLKAKGEGGIKKAYRYNWEGYDKHKAGFRTKLESSRTIGVGLKDGCSTPATDSIGIKVKKPPRARFRMNPKDTVYLNNAVKFQNRSKYAKWYRWDFGTAQGRVKKPSPRHTFRDTGNYLVELIAGSANSCKDTLQKNLYVNDDYEVYIPNAFSPDGNGVNEEWAIKGQGIDKYSFQIYNRWGAKIHTTTENMDKPSWDGTYKNSEEPVSPGIYLYKLKVRDRANRVYYYHGELQLIR